MAFKRPGEIKTVSKKNIIEGSTSVDIKINIKVNTVIVSQVMRDILLEIEIQK